MTSRSFGQNVLMISDQVDRFEKFGSMSTGISPQQWDTECENLTETKKIIG